MRASCRVFSILAVVLMVVGPVPPALATPPTPAAVDPNSRTYIMEFPSLVRSRLWCDPNGDVPSDQPSPGVALPHASFTPEREVGILETCDASRKDDRVSHRRAIIEGSIDARGTHADSVGFGSTNEFEDRTVLVKGPLSVHPSAADPASRSWDLASAGGDAALKLEGVLPRVLVAAYARIWGDALIENPRRRHLVQLVRETPGIHTRELQRRCGLQWGVFSGHLHVLVRAGHLALVRDGRYRRVHARGALPVGTAWVPHAIARCLLALLRDGPLPANACRERLGVTRQRLDHHIARLVDAGLVRVALDPASGTRVVELSPGATREAPHASGGLQPPRRA